MVSAVYRRVVRLPAEHPLIRIGRSLRRISWVRRITDRVLGIRPDGVIPAAAVAPLARSGSVRPAAPAFAVEDKAFFQELLRRASVTRPALAAVPRRVLLVNAGLAAGGAERQVVNTLVGLSRQQLESVAFLGEYLFESPERCFLLPELAASGIAVATVEKRTRLGEAGFAGIEAGLAELLGLMPAQFVEEILDLAAEFRDRRPEVLHAWQDSTSIKCGIAGVIAGVPRIVLSSRNVNPSNFAYHQPYMRPAYQALAERREIVLANNSEAGAADFCRWLGLPRERYRVVRNGVALDDLKPDASGARALRDQENIPQDALVVGSIFRFWPEKRPLLWLDIAARLLTARPRTHFLLVGDGPLREQMLAFLAGLPHAENIHLIAPTNAVGRVLSAMNLFLLTSRFEGTPNVVLEAEWLGLPVVAMEAGGVGEAVAPGENGVVCTDDSPETAVLHLCEMIDDPRWSERAREIGPRFVRERFGPDRMIGQTMALYGYAVSAGSA